MIKKNHDKKSIKLFTCKTFFVALQKIEIIPFNLPLIVFVCFEIHQQLPKVPFDTPQNDKKLKKNDAMCSIFSAFLNTT